MFGLKLLLANHYANNNTKKLFTKKAFSKKHINVSLFKHAVHLILFRQGSIETRWDTEYLDWGLLWISTHSEVNARTVSQIGPGPLMSSCPSELLKASLNKRVVPKSIPEKKQHHMQSYGREEIASLNLNLGPRGRSLFTFPSVAVSPSFQSQMRYYYF
jgi:hypothetical protein